MQLVSNPWQFDVMVLTNLYGTIVSNLICGLIGGPGLTAGANYGPRYALFEPGTRNTGTKLAGQNNANPIAMLTASVELLKHLHLNRHAEVIYTYNPLSTA
jgi:isocitrate dehydrogenase (NAD+)